MRLRPLLRLCLAITLFVHPRAAAGQHFEGVIRERMVLASPGIVARLLGAEPSPENVEQVFALDMERLLAAASVGPAAGGQVTERTLYVSGEKMRVEAELPGGLGTAAVIFDGDAGTVTVLVPVVRSYLVMDEELMRDQLVGLTAIYAGAANIPAPRVEPIGAATIAGLEAEGYEIHAGDGLVARGWTAPALRGILPIEPADRDPLFALTERGLPVRTQGLIRAAGTLTMLYGPGYLYFATEVLSAERTSVDAAKFTVPSDYTRMETGGALPGIAIPQD